MASESELQDAADDAALAVFARDGVKRYKVRDREVEMHDPESLLKAAFLARALNSPRRGMNLGKIDKPA